MTALRVADIFLIIVTGQMTVLKTIPWLVVRHHMKRKAGPE